MSERQIDGAGKVAANAVGNFTDSVTEICHRLQPADPVANRDC